jgi:AraC-like DNA-binding protein
MASPFGRRSSLTTTDPDEAHAYLRATYVDHSVRLSGSVDRFRFRHDIVDGGGFSVAGYHHSMRCRVQAEPLEQLLVAQMVGGRLSVVCNDDEVAPSVGEVVLLTPGVGLTVEWENWQAGLVGVDLAVVNRVAGEIFGAALPGVRFTEQRAVTPERGRHWQALVRYVCQEVLPNPFASSSALIHQGVCRLLAATVLETFPNTAAIGDVTGVGAVAAGAVRRATAFIEERAGDPITLTDIADAAQLSPRALQAAFRRHLETTPMAHLRSVRLEGAHHDLLRADRAVVTVAQIAARWGFVHHGRFSAMYRARYGCTPTSTADR